MTYKPKQHTSIKDLSSVYGSSQEDGNRLRTLDGSGKLKLDRNGLLPFIRGDEETDSVRRRAGDSRANEMPGLTAMHTLFAREHNRICHELRSSHPKVTPDWSDEDIFQNARRILVAVWQKMVYGEFLPVVLGRRGLDYFNGMDLYPWHGSTYHTRVSPTIRNEFTTSVFRFGHTITQGLVSQADPATLREVNQFILHENIRNLSVYESRQGMDQILAGGFTQPAQFSDPHVTNEMRNLLFNREREPFNVGEDLVARNIQRGRDHGIASYSALVQNFAGPKFRRSRILDCWRGRPSTISPYNWKILRSIYHHPSHIDLFTGSLAETLVPGGMLGPLNTKLLAWQFQFLKFGDRFFFTHKGQFTNREYMEIMRRSLAHVICDNTQILRVPNNVFRLNRGYKHCSLAKSMDISRFDVKRVPNH